MGITVPRIISSAASRLPESAPENAITRAYIGPPFRSEGPILRLCCGGALGRALAAALLAPEHQGAGDPRKREPEQRLVRPSALDGRSRALCLAFHDALADLPDAPAEDGVAAVDDAHARCSSRCAIRPHGRSPYGLLVGVASERSASLVAAVALHAALAARPLALAVGRGWRRSGLLLWFRRLVGLRLVPCLAGVVAGIRLLRVLDALAAGSRRRQLADLAAVCPILGMDLLHVRPAVMS